MSALPDTETSPQIPQLLTGRFDTGELFALRRIDSAGDNVALFVTNWQPGGSRAVSCHLKDTWDELTDLYGAPPPRTAIDSWSRLETCIARGGAAFIRDDTGAPVAIALHHTHNRRRVDARLPTTRQAAILAVADEAVVLTWMRAIYESIEASRAVLSERAWALEHPPQPPPEPEPDASLEWPKWYRPRRRFRAGKGVALVDTSEIDL
jgi:hypothetical protein